MRLLPSRILFPFFGAWHLPGPNHFWRLILHVYPASVSSKKNKPKQNC